MFYTTYYRRDITAMVLCTLLLLQSCQSHRHIVGDEVDVPREREVGAQQEGGSAAPAIVQPDSPQSSSQSPSRSAASYVLSAAQEQVSPITSHSLASPLRPITPSLALGKEAWSEYFGDVGDVPLLPSDIENTLNEDCPFWSGRKVRDTHLLVLVPEKVDGNPLTLNKCCSLLRRYFPDNIFGYRDFDIDVKSEFGRSTPPSSHWVLLTRDIVPNSRGRTYEGCLSLISSHSVRPGICCRFPTLLEVSVAVLLHYLRTGERLLGDNPVTYTYCYEISSDGFPPIVGRFGSAGLYIDDSDFDIPSRGVCCCHEL